jgi:DNA-binding SARP family transcriptional activator
VLTEDVQDEIWGDDRPGSARTTIQVYVSKIRRSGCTGWPSGERGALRTVPGGYQLDVAELDVDAYDFLHAIDRARVLVARRDDEAAVDAFGESLALWSGPPLTDVNCGPRLTVFRESLERIHRDVIEERAEALIRVGQYHQASTELTQLLRSEPYREKGYAHLMISLGRAGRRQEALEVFHRARAILRDDLGVEPSAQLCRIQQSILSGTDHLPTAS